MSERKFLVGSCLIKNRNFPEYLYPADGFDYDSMRRQVFTWIPGNQEPKFFWSLERCENQKTIQYKIKNTNNNEYLYAAASGFNFDAQRRRVFTWKPKSGGDEQCFWDIQLVDQVGGKHYYTIRNLEFGEYLYADSRKHNTDRRLPFTWKYDPNHDVNKDHQSQWSIEFK